MAKRFGVMLDMSRNAVMKPEQVKKFAKVISAFGYNMIELYTEDTYTVDGEPYFGYMRGRYTKEELKDRLFLRRKLRLLFKKQVERLTNGMTADLFCWLVF